MLWFYFNLVMSTTLEDHLARSLIWFEYICRAADSKMKSELNSGHALSPQIRATSTKPFWHF